jgi:hypothetical protein
MKNITHAQMIKICKQSRKQLKSQEKRLEALKNG